MDFEFTPAHEQIRTEIRAYLRDNQTVEVARQALDGSQAPARELWRGLVELGLPGLAIPEEHGGAGAGDLELCVVAEELGRAVAAVPFSSSVGLATALIVAAGTEEQKRRYLPALASGQAVGCFALPEGPGDPFRGVLSVTASDRGELHGTKWPVLDGDSASFAIVAAREDGDMSLFLVDLDQPAVTREQLETLDPSRGQARLTFRGAPASRIGRIGEGRTLAERAIDRTAVLTAFEQIGGAEAALEMARDYALERSAFGRPIGSFQAIKHKLADMYIAVVLARSNAYNAAWALASEPTKLPLAAATARVSATQAFQFCARENIQIHGGMGFTWQFDCHLYYRRAQLLALSLGSLARWQDRLVEGLKDHRRSGALA